MLARPLEDREGFNWLKYNECSAEHNLGHGHSGLSDTLLVLKRTAFAFHSVCNHLSQLWRAAATYQILSGLKTELSPCHSNPLHVK